MKDFFAHQEHAKRLSFRLIVLFVLAVIGIALTVYIAAALIISWSSTYVGVPTGLWQPRLFLWTTGITIVVICAGSFWKIHSLREGGGAVARILGARPVTLQSSDPRERILRNVVNEMAIASGVPVPGLYIMDMERGINAFAAGLGFDDAVVCVTRGAVELLDRDELQGVVAHEFSHILNGDMRLNLRLLGWLNGILLLGLTGKAVIKGIDRVSAPLAASAVIFAAVTLLVIGYVGYFFGLLIKCAVSRQREYLGDSSAVQFTRNPGGLASALKKIGGLAEGSRLDHPRVDELSHLYFGNGLKKSWLYALDTHPPLLERIRLLEPGFNGIFLQATPLPAPSPDELLERIRYFEPRFNGIIPQATSIPAPPPEEIDLAPRPGAAEIEMGLALTGTSVAAILETVGQPVRKHIDHARRLMTEIPGQIRSATSNSLSACALVCGLLLDRDPTIREKQLGIIESHWIPAVAAEVRALLPLIELLSRAAYLPLIDLSLPALRTLSREQFLRLNETVSRLSAADNKTSLFEFMLRRLLTRHLEPHFNPRQKRPPQIYSLRGVRQQCSLLLSVMARLGHRDEVAARQAFVRGAKVLNDLRTQIPFVPANECTPSALERALWDIDGASLPIKRRLLASCLECLIHDERVTVSEIELFRAIADAVGCPVPPWLNITETSSH